MWLLIDDERNLNTEAVARTAAAGKKLLALGGWDCVCFDHDLGEEESGYDVLKWALVNELLPSKVQLVTSNPVGRQNMRAALEAHGYKTGDGINFRIVTEAATVVPVDELISRADSANVLLRVMDTAAEQIRRCDYVPARSTLLTAIANAEKARGYSIRREGRMLRPLAVRSTTHEAL